MLQRLDALSLPAGATLTVAFSGGGDSLALAVCLGRLREHRPFRPHLLHVDHQLRADSSEDAEKCAQLAHDLGLPIAQRTLRPDLADRAQALGIEGSARAERYEALASMAREQGAWIVSTGHHQGDQAETVLLHLFRGSGLRGLAGMSELGIWPVEYDAAYGQPELRVWRPFLSEPKSVLIEYVKNAGFTLLHDSSNDDLAFRRNAIRHSFLPVVERAFPGAEASLARLAGLAREDADYLDATASAHRRELESADGGLAVSGLSSLPAPLASRVVRSWLLEAGVEEPTRERTFDVLEFARDGSESSHLEAGSGRIVLRDGESLRCCSPEALLDLLCQRVGVLPLGDENSVQLRSESSSFLRFDTAGWWVEIRLGSCRPEAQFDSIAVPDAISPDSITVRRSQPGDLWYDTHEPVKESLRISGIHPYARWRIACVACDNMVYALPGVSRKRKRLKDNSHETNLAICWGTTKGPT